jgi:hypothetical protein
VSRSLNILHTSELYAPSLGGSQEVLRQISERLVKKGHRVTVATSTLEERRVEELNGVEIEQFPLSGNYVNGMDGDLEKYRQFVKGSDNDIMLNYGAQIWPTDALLDSINELHTYNILVPVGFSYLRNEAYSDYYSNMERWLTEYDACVYMSNIDPAGLWPAEASGSEHLLGGHLAGASFSLALASLAARASS